VLDEGLIAQYVSLEIYHARCDPTPLPHIEWNPLWQGFIMTYQCL